MKVKRREKTKRVRFKVCIMIFLGALGIHGATNPQKETSIYDICQSCEMSGLSFPLMYLVVSKVEG